MLLIITNGLIDLEYDISWETTREVRNASKSNAGFWMDRGWRLKEIKYV